VPADRLKILRTAFEQTMKDAALVQEAESAGLHPLYISPDELQKLVAEGYKMSPEVVALTKKALGH
jgi:tripartite-type tricarboxylate transporter receptor subunit TctC